MTIRVQSGQMLGDYRLLQQLGQGGFAEVFLAEHQYLKHRVAIKVLTIPLNAKESDRFIEEARTMARLKHPHIVGCSDFRIEQGVPFLVMDYVPGGTLRDRHPDGSIVPLSDVVNYVSQIHPQRLKEAQTDLADRDRRLHGSRVYPIHASGGHRSICPGDGCLRMAGGNAALWRL